MFSRIPCPSSNNYFHSLNKCIWSPCHVPGPHLALSSLEESRSRTPHGPRTLMQTRASWHPMGPVPLPTPHNRRQVPPGSRGAPPHAAATRCTPLPPLSLQKLDCGPFQGPRKEACTERARRPQCGGGEARGARSSGGKSGGGRRGDAGGGERVVRRKKEGGGTGRGGVVFES